MSKLWISILENTLNVFNWIGDNSGCHQIKERCFCIKGYVFPICARCTGVFIGQFFSVFIAFLRIKIPVVYALFLLSIMGIDWFIQQVGILQSNNQRRFITGICGGFGIFEFYKNCICYLIFLIGTYIL